VSGVVSISSYLALREAKAWRIWRSCVARKMEMFAHAYGDMEFGEATADADNAHFLVGDHHLMVVRMGAEWPTEVTPRWVADNSEVRLVMHVTHRDGREGAQDFWVSKLANLDRKRIVLARQHAFTEYPKTKLDEERIENDRDRDGVVVPLRRR